MLQNTSTKTINLVIAIISVAVPSLVIAMLKFAPPAITHNIDLSFFPKFHAFVNTGTTLCLLTGLFFIKNKNSSSHRIAMLTALLLSVVFLLSYVIYHTLKAEDSKFGGEIYLSIVAICGNHRSFGVRVYGALLLTLNSLF